MKTKHFVAFGLAMAIATTSGMASADADGGKLFKKKCGVCHKMDKDAIGPALKGVVGRKAGSTGFKKFKALKGASFTWDEATLDAWITNQKDFLKSKGIDKKTAMSVKIKKAEDREEIIEYLKKNG